MTTHTEKHQARKNISKLTEKFNRSREVRFLMSAAQLARDTLEENDQAIHLYNQVLEHETTPEKIVPVFLSLAKLYGAEGMADNAVDVLKKACALRPNAKTYGILAQYALDQNAPHDAIGHLTHALEYAEDSSSEFKIHLQISKIYEIASTGASHNVELQKQLLDCADQSLKNASEVLAYASDLTPKKMDWHKSELQRIRLRIEPQINRLTHTPSYD